MEKRWAAHPGVSQQVARKSSNFFDSDRDASCTFIDEQECLDAHAKGWKSQQDLIETCDSWNFDRLKLCAGNVVETTEAFAKTELGTRISLLYIDIDNYEGALACLENLYPLLTPGGVVAFDEYALPGFGESNAVDEFFAQRSETLKSIVWASTPTAYVVKGS